MRRSVLVMLALILVGAAVSFAQPPQRVAVLPFAVHSSEDLAYVRDGIWDIISTRIIVEGKIQVVDKSLTRRFLTELQGMEVTEREARWLGLRVGADYVVYGSITKVGDFFSLDAKVVNVPGVRPTTSAFSQHKGLDDLMGKVDVFAQDIAGRIMGRATSAERRGPGQLRQQLMSQAIGYTKMQAFPNQKLKGVDVGDVTGDGTNEIVIIGERTIWIYRDEEKALKQVAEFTEDAAHIFLTVDLMDLDGDKRAEICVTSAREDGDLQSFIMRYDNGTFTPVATTLRWYQRAKELPEQGRVLLGQRIGTDRDFTGPIRQVVLKKDNAKLGAKLKLPDFVEWVYEFEAGSITAPEVREYLATDETGAVRVKEEQGSTLWRSGEDLGGSDNWFDRRGLLRDRYGAASQFERRIYVPLRMAVKDLDGDGIDEVIAPVNKFRGGAHLEKVRVYDKGYITCRVWDGLALAGLWRTQDIPGYVADFQIKDCDNDGLNELIVASFTGHFLKQDTRGTLTVYELYE